MNTFRTDYLTILAAVVFGIIMGSIIRSCDQDAYACEDAGVAVVDAEVDAEVDSGLISVDSEVDTNEETEEIIVLYTDPRPEYEMSTGCSFSGMEKTAGGYAAIVLFALLVGAGVYILKIKSRRF